MKSKYEVSEVEELCVPETGSRPMQLDRSKWKAKEQNSEITKDFRSHKKHLMSLYLEIVLRGDDII